MAHIAKYKAHSCGHMLAHYRRDKSSLERDNIDPRRTHLNRTFGDAQANWAVIEARIRKVDEGLREQGKRATRKDAVVMADMVLTLPENVPLADEPRFFAFAYEFLGEKVGRENLLGGFVHRDEMRTRVNPETGEAEWTGERVRDHIHVPYTPILDGRFNFKQMCPRAFYQTLHRELGDYLEARMGYRPEIELGEERRAEKALSGVEKGKIDAAREAIVAPAERRAAEVVREAEERAWALDEEIAYRDGVLCEIEGRIASKEVELSDLGRERARVADEIEAEQRRLESLRRRSGAVERDVEQLGAVASLVRECESAGRGGKGQILAQIASRCDSIRLEVQTRWQAVREALARALRPAKPKQVPGTAMLMGALRELDRGGGVDLADELRDARMAADAINAARTGKTHNRGQGAR